MRIIRNFCLIGLVASNLLYSAFVRSASVPVDAIPNINASIQVDGQLDEIAWQSALSIELSYEVEPAENTLPPVVTRALLFENGENLFIAFVAKDKDPKAIRAFLSERDNVENSDQVYVKLDTFNNARSAFKFAVNPLGVQSDSLIDEQTENDDSRWDAIWYSAGKVTDEGYQVEIQIPFQALRFSTGKSPKDWGIELGRFWPREVLHRFTNSAIDRNISCRICQFAKINGFASAEAPENLTIIPVLTLLKSDSRPATKNSSWVDGDTERRLSLDLRWGISQDTYLNATINPDFSQVEADALQLDVNNLSTLFLEEKRAFFQDGADFFNHWSRLVYTRIFEEPVAGVKVTSTSGNHSFGLMSVQDKNTNLLFPYEYGTELLKLNDYRSDNTIFRYRYDLGEKSNIGTTLTFRSAEDYQSSMLGIDGKYWLSENDSIKYQLLGSATDYPQVVLEQRSEQKSSLAGNAYSFNYQHDSRNWLLRLTYHRFDEDFRADTGFISFGNWQRGALEFARTWFAEDPKSWWKQIKLNGVQIESREIDNTLIDKSTEMFVTIDAIYETEFVIGAKDGVKNYIDPSFPSQQQTEFIADTQYIWTQFNPLPAVKIELEYEWGDDIDYDKHQPAQVNTFTSIFNLQLSDQLSSELEYVNESLDVFGDSVYRANLANLILAYRFNEKTVLRLTLQRSDLNYFGDNIDKEYVSSQAIYSYQVNPFTLLYIGYSDRFKTDIDSLALVKTDKTLFMKFSYAWQR